MKAWSSFCRDAQTAGAGLFGGAYLGGCVELQTCVGHVGRGGTTGAVDESRSLRLWETASTCFMPDQERLEKVCSFSNRWTRTRPTLRLKSGPLSPLRPPRPPQRPPFFAGPATTAPAVHCCRRRRPGRVVVDPDAACPSRVAWSAFVCAGSHHSL